MDTGVTLTPEGTLLIGDKEVSGAVLFEGKELEQMLPVLSQEILDKVREAEPLLWTQSTLDSLPVAAFIPQVRWEGATTARAKVGGATALRRSHDTRGRRPTFLYFLYC